MNTPTPLHPSDYALILRCARNLRRKLPPMVDIGDLINDGYLGFLDAIRCFDPSRNVSFERYAPRRIRGAMLDGLRGRAWVPRLICKADGPTPKVVLREVECTTSADSVCKNLDDSDERRWIRTMLTTLPRQARRVIHLYDYEEHQLKEVAMILGVTEARVSQIRSRAIRNLQKQTHRAAA